MTGTPPSEASLDTSRIQTALNGCAAGQAVRLTTSGASNGFITGPLNLPTGVSLWVDSGVTLFGTRDPGVYGQATALISVRGANSGIVGTGAIDGQGGEPQIGSTMSSWDVNGGGGDSPALIQVLGATNFTLYKITLHNAPKFHVKLGAAGFVVWGITIKTPSTTTNSVGTKLTPSSAHNTDGVDPGEAASNGFIVYNQISVGDDHIAIKGGTSVKNLTIAHNHFEAGHGMSIGSETNGGVSDVTVCDLSIDGTNTGLSGGSANGIRIKSDPSRGGLVQNIFYGDVCVRGLTNPIILTPMYSSATGTEYPHYHGDHDPELPLDEHVDHAEGDAARVRRHPHARADARQRGRRRHHLGQHLGLLRRHHARPRQRELHPLGHERHGEQQGHRLVDAQRLHEQVGDFLARASRSRSRQIDKESAAPAPRTAVLRGQARLPAMAPALLHLWPGDATMRNKVPGRGGAGACLRLDRGGSFERARRRFGARAARARARRSGARQPGSGSRLQQASGGKAAS